MIIVSYSNYITALCWIYTFLFSPYINSFLSHPLYTSISNWYFSLKYLSPFCTFYLNSFTVFFLCSMNISKLPITLSFFYLYLTLSLTHWQKGTHNSYLLLFLWRWFTYLEFSCGLISFSCTTKTETERWDSISFLKTIITISMITS